MFRRLFWLGCGFGLGIAARRRFRSVTAERVGARVRDAVREGRVEAREREATLRDVLASPRAPNPGQ
jgi:hypothetical protein